MEMCLYDSELGYYSRTAEQFGKAGDFYTSSDVHAVFGRLLARQFEEMWRVLGSPDRVGLLELGPGRGLFAQDVLDWSEKKFPEFFRALHYVLVESSPALRQRIVDTLSRHLEAGKATLTQKTLGAEANDGARTAEGADKTANGTTSVMPIEGLNTRALATEVPTIIFANEFFDALPVEIVSPQGSLRIDARDGRFIETWVLPSARELEFLDRYSVHPEDGERVDVPLLAQRYANRLFAEMPRGFFLAIDYGYTREEQLAGRHRGTLKAIRQHSMSANP